MDETTLKTYCSTIYGMALALKGLVDDLIDAEIWTTKNNEFNKDAVENA